MLKIKSSNTKVIKSLKTLYNDVLKVNDNLGTWENELKQYDSLYLNLRVVEKVGVVKMKKPELYESMHFKLPPDIKQRTDETVRKCILMELIRVGIIHLFAQGFNEKQVTNFDINL